MSAFGRLVRSLGQVVPAFRRHYQLIDALIAERDALAQQVALQRTSGMPIGDFRVPSPAPLTRPEQGVVDAFHHLYYSSWQQGQPTIDVSWFGWRTLKCPLDLWIYQELIVADRPDVIIECGTRYGGSAAYLACLFDLLGEGRVISIDIDTDPALNRPQHPRITYVAGSSIAPEVVEPIKAEVAGKRVMVILDSDHSEAHVLAELRVWNSVVPIGGWLIVEDTNVNGHPTHPGHGPGPMEAVERFLSEQPAFVADPACERFRMTLNPRGYLRRIAA